MMTSLEAVWMGAIAAFTLTAIVFDLRWQRIPNWLTVSALVVGLLFQTATSGTAGLLNALGGFATGFGLLLVVWLIGAGGAGDVKLMGALGAWLGATLTLYTLIGSAVFVAVLGSAYLGVTLLVTGPARLRHRQLATAGDVSLTPVPRRARRGIMPYALPLGLAAWVVVLWKVFAPHTSG